MAHRALAFLIFTRLVQHLCSNKISFPTPTIPWWLDRMHANPRRIAGGVDEGAPYTNFFGSQRHFVSSLSDDCFRETSCTLWLYHLDGFHPLALEQQAPLSLLPFWHACFLCASFPDKLLTANICCLSFAVRCAQMCSPSISISFARK